MLFSHLKDVFQGKTTLGHPRSSHWPVVRAAHLKDHPNCAVCGEHRHVNVHHIRPFHLEPALELDPTNLITLCEYGSNGLNCHLWFGHLGNFKLVNVNVVTDALAWCQKYLAARMKG